MLKVKDLMTKKIEYVMPDCELREVAEIMKDKDIGIVPVCDEEKKLLGVITDRDIVIRNIARNKGDMKAEEIMTRRITTATPSDNIYEVSKKMAKHKVRRIPIVENNKLVGIISIADIIIEKEFALEIAEAMFEISK